MKPIPGTEGCSDGGCIFGHPGGMHTNGGCACMKDIYPQKRRFQITRNIQIYLKLIAELQAEIAALKESK